jgi:hypothetical protein
MRHILAALLLMITPALAQTPPLALVGTTPTSVPGTDVTLQLTNITDQRCPANVTCVWQGMIRLELAVTAGSNAPEPVILCNACEGASPDAVVKGGYILHLREVFPSTTDLALLGRPTEIADYTITLDVGIQ